MPACLAVFAACALLANTAQTTSNEAVRRAALTHTLTVAAHATAPSGDSAAASYDASIRASDSPSTLYLLHCSGCHGADGMGERRADVPPLPPYVGNFLRDPLGRQYVANVGGVTSSGLNAADTAAVLNWVMERFAGPSLPKNAPKFDADEIRALRANREVDSVTLRRAIAGRLRKQGVKLADYPWP